MKVHELVKNLQEIPNQDAEVFVQYLLEATESHKAIPGVVKINHVQVETGKEDVICIIPESIKEEI